MTMHIQYLVKPLFLSEFNNRKYMKNNSTTFLYSQLLLMILPFTCLILIQVVMQLSKRVGV